MGTENRTIVIGGGITGLTAAWRLHRADVDVEVLEANPDAGGVIRTEDIDGFLAELGPNTLQETREETALLLEELGLSDKRVAAGGVARNRFILKNGRPTALPLSPFSLFFGRFFSLPARLNLLAEPFRRASPKDAQETVADFVRRRLGREILDYAVNPFVAGTFAARPQDLSLRHAFPRLYRMEREHGSLVRAGLFGKRYRPKGQRGIFSFSGGLRTLPETLAARLSGRIRTGVRVTDLDREANGRWRIGHESGGRQASLSAGGVVLALPPHALKNVRLNGRTFDERVRIETRLPAPPLAVVFLGYRRDQVAHPLNGFGMLIPEKENRRILGVLFSSALFPGRAPEGCVSLTVFVGGGRQPDYALLPEDERETLVREELSDLLGAEGTPRVVRHAVWPNVIPHYPLHHGSLLDDLDAVENDHPGLLIGGPVRQGVSIGDCIGSGYALAERATPTFPAPATDPSGGPET